MSKSIAIIGAGIAGLSAAQKLHENGFNEIHIFEAMDRIGGRIHSLPFENNVLELGAQWIHGEGNPLYDWANVRNLISNPNEDSGIEGEGIFCTDSGIILDSEEVDQIICYLDQIKEDMRQNGFTLSENSNEIVSAKDIFRDSFVKYMTSDKCPLIKNDLLWSLFNWFIKFEVIDNSCDDFNEVSLLSYTEWRTCDGIYLINLKDSYQTVIDSLIKDIPKDRIRLKTPIKRIEICDKTLKVKLNIENTDIVEKFDHLIVTVSLGYMQQNFDTFFGFKLNHNKSDVIKSLGFGTINKIYLYFDEPFWKLEDKGFQLIWTKHSHNLPNWVYDISGFDLVRGQPNVLLAWIGGNGAKQIEQIESDESIGNTCANVLRLFLPAIDIKNPSKVIRTKWSTNKYICGAYSNRSVDYEKLKCGIEYLSQPVLSSNHSIDWPLVLFAGEATDREYYSAAHGAMRSGLREAQRLIDLYNKT